MRNQTVTVASNFSFDNLREAELCTNSGKTGKHDEGELHAVYMLSLHSATFWIHFEPGPDSRARVHFGPNRDIASRAKENCTCLDVCVICWFGFYVFDVLCIFIVCDIIFQNSSRADKRTNKIVRIGKSVHNTKS